MTGFGFSAMWSSLWVCCHPLRPALVTSARRRFAGGVSKHHWSDALVAEQVVRIVSQTQDISWQIIDSRRTPESYRRQLKPN